MVKDTALYDLLGVKPEASDAEIKKAYRKKAMENHPDKNPGDAEAGERFQAIANAYEILSNSTSRESYDNFGSTSTSGGMPGGPDVDMDDIFASMFGGAFGADPFAGPGAGGRRGRSSRPRRGRDEIVDYEVTLEDLFKGKTVSLMLEKNIICGTCEGHGGKPGTKPKTCVRCDGKGSIMMSRQVGPGLIGQMPTVCPECDGEGVKIREKDRCKKCKGAKVVKTKKRVEIHIEKGMRDGQRIVLEGEGDQEPGVTPGNLIFALRLLPHPTFQVAHPDLSTTITLTLSEALLGFSRVVLTHLDGRGVHVSVQAGERVVQPGETMVLRGEGMWVGGRVGRAGERGDLYVRCEVEMPSTHWIKGADWEALEKLLPPRRPDLQPRPEVVDEAEFEHGDMANFGKSHRGFEDTYDEYESEQFPGGTGQCPAQ